MKLLRSILSQWEAIAMIAFIIVFIVCISIGYIRFKQAEQNCANKHGVFFNPHGFQNICLRQDQVITVEVNQ